MFSIQHLDLKHNRTDVCSRSDALNQYFYQQVSQDIRKKVTQCFVALDCDIENPTISGFYTLAACSVSLQDLPLNTQKKLPRYPSIPVVRLGRLAVDQQYIGIGLGAALLVDAIQRVKSLEIGVFAMLVDAKDEDAIKFYQHHGFVEFEHLENVLFLTI